MNRAELARRTSLRSRDPRRAYPLAGPSPGARASARSCAAPPRARFGSSASVCRTTSATRKLHQSTTRPVCKFARGARALSRARHARRARHEHNRPAARPAAAHLRAHGRRAALRARREPPARDQVGAFDCLVGAGGPDSRDFCLPMPWSAREPRTPSSGFVPSTPRASSSSCETRRP